MKKNRIWKAALICLFVFVAGVVYSCGAGGHEAVVEQADRDSAVPEGVGLTGVSGAAGQGALQGQNGSLGGVSALPGDSAQETAGAAVSEPAGQVQKELCYVHVCGAVKNPGVYALEKGARVADAVAAAGGFSADAAQDYLNQARRVSDGERLYVPDTEEINQLSGEEDWFLQNMAVSDGEGDTSADGGAGTGDGRVNINTATKERLMQLSGIGASRAEAIIAYREEHGGFSACEELMQVPGIKEATYQKLCEEITIGD